MTDENRAKIREALTWMDHFAKRQCDGTIEHVANEALDALAILDAEDTPSVPISEEAADRAIKFDYSIAELIAAHGYLADPDDAPRVAHVIRECLVPHITAALGDGELTTRPQSSEKALPPLSEREAQDLAMSTDYAIEACDNNGETPLNVPDAAEFFRLGYESARAAITKAPEGVADVADVDPNRDNVRRAQHGTD